MVPHNTARKCPLRAASGPPGSAVLGLPSCTRTIPTSQRGGMARSQCLGKNVTGSEQEGILEKYGSFISYDLIHLEQAPSAPSQRNSPEV